MSELSPLPSQSGSNATRDPYGRSIQQVDQQFNDYTNKLIKHMLKSIIYTMFNTLFNDGIESEIDRFL